MRLNFREGGSRQYNWCVFILYYYNFLSYNPLSFSSISQWSFHIHVRSFESRGALKCFPWRHMISSSDILLSPHRKNIPKSQGFFFFKKCVFISLNLFRSVKSLLRKDFIFWMIWYVLSALKAASVKGFKSLRVVESCQRALRCVCGLPNNFGGEFSKVGDQVIPLLIWVFAN